MAGLSTFACARIQAATKTEVTRLEGGQDWANREDV